MKIISEVLELLRDGQWHTLEEIQEKTGLNTFKTLLLSNFLISYNFCIYISGVATIPPCPIKTLKLKDDIIHFLKQLEKLETDMENLKNV